MHRFLQVAADVQERGTFRRAEPLVAVARIEVRVDCAEIERKVSRHVRAVDDRRDAALSCARAERLDRELHGRLGGYVAHEQCSSALGNAGPDLLDDVVGVAQRQRHGHADVSRARVRADVIPGKVEGAVFEIGTKDFVAGSEIERPGGDVHARGDIGDEDEVLRIGRDVFAQRSTRRREQAVKPAREKFDRPALELELPLLVALEDGARAGAERTVIQEDDVRIEQEVVTKSHRHAGK